MCIRDRYNALLDEQSFPFEEQAIAIHEINAKRVLDGVYDDSVRASFKALAELKPARYGKTELSVGGVATLSPPAQAIAASPDAVVAQTHRDGSLEDSEQALKRATALDPSNALAWTCLLYTSRCV